MRGAAAGRWLRRISENCRQTSRVRRAAVARPEQTRCARRPRSSQYSQCLNYGAAAPQRYVLHQVEARALGGLLHLDLLVREAGEQRREQLVVRQAPLFSDQHELADPGDRGEADEFIAVMSLANDRVDLANRTDKDEPSY